MALTYRMRPAWPAPLTWLLAFLLLALYGVGCAGNEPSTPLPEDRGVDESPAVATGPTGGAATASVPALPLRDEAAFAAYVQEQLNRGQFGALREEMSEPFVLQLHPTGIFAESIDDALFALQFRFVTDRDAAIRVDDVDASQLVSQQVDPMALYRGPQPVTRVLASSGWGLAESGVGLLFLTEEEGELRWAGLTLAHGSNGARPFTALPGPDTTPPPAGLSYTLGDEWWQVRDQGQDRLLAGHESRLSVNPPGTLAVSAEIGAPEVLVFDFKRALTKIITLEDTIILDVMNTPWLDEYTVVIGIAEGLGSVTQATTGRLALLDVQSSAVTPLGPEISTYAYASASGNTLIVDSNEGIWLRQGEIARFLSLDGVQALNPRGNLFSPVLAPDLKRVAGVIGGDFGRHGHGYVVVDVETGTSNLVHTFLSTPTDARVSWGIQWNEDGNWLALEPPSWDPLEAGVWLVRPDGSEGRTLGPGTANAVWLDGERLAYTHVVDGASRVALLDLATGEAARLDLPPEARPVAFVAED